MPRQPNQVRRRTAGFLTECVPCSRALACRAERKATLGDPVAVDNRPVRTTRKTRLLAAAGLLSLISGYLTPRPASVILFNLGVLITVVLVVVRPRESDLAAQASAACDDPDLMTAWEAAEVAGEAAKTVVLALDRDGVPRADRLGWRAKLPVPMTRIRYRRADIARWLSTRRET